MAKIRVCPASALHGAVTLTLFSQEDIMTKSATLLLTAACAGFLATAATAQTSAFNNQDRASDAIDDLDEDIEDDFDRDPMTYGNEGRELGFTGSVSLRGTATDGNTDNIDVGIGGRFGYFDGLNGNEVTLVYAYAEEESARSENSVLFGYDYTREIGASTFVFGKAVYAFDEFSSVERDAFVSVGLGYRIFNTENLQWSVQAGPGYRSAENADGTDIEEVAFSVSSDYMTKFSDTLFLTNDTDVLASDSDTFVTNELGLNVPMTDTLALRTSILTEYRSDPQPGFQNTDNTFGVALVYTFN
jgi:putative salt-induced outer membrane protein